MRVFPLLLALGAAGFGQALGSWEMTAASSSFPEGPRPEKLTVRIESHSRGEVFTVDTLRRDGRATSSSTILYLDGMPRELRDFDCSGTQSSRKVDSQTVEILRTCGHGESARWVGRVSTDSKELVLEITEHHSDGRKGNTRIVMVRQDTH
jgi:hypothetical protein